MWRALRDRDGDRRRLLLLLYVPVVALLALMVALAVLVDVPVGALTRDPAALAQIPPYYGAVSMLGLQLWGAAAVVCLFTALLLWGRGRDGVGAFLFWSGMLTGLLLVDDALMLHEHSERLLGIDNKVLFALYGGAVAALLWCCRGVVLGTEWPVLLFGLACFASSMLADVMHDTRLLQKAGIVSADARFFLEDGFKLLGITSWLIYYGRTCHGLLRVRIGTVELQCSVGRASGRQKAGGRRAVRHEGAVKP